MQKSESTAKLAVAGRYGIAASVGALAMLATVAATIYVPALRPLVSSITARVSQAVAPMRPRPVSISADGGALKLRNGMAFSRSDLLLTSFKKRHPNASCESKYGRLFCNVDWSSGLCGVSAACRPTYVFMPDGEFASFLGFFRTKDWDALMTATKVAYGPVRPTRSSELAAKMFTWGIPIGSFSLIEGSDFRAVQFVPNEPVIGSSGGKGGQQNARSRRNLSDGAIPKGLSLSQFQQDHADANCFDMSGDKECEILAPTPDLCIETGCEDAVYGFHNGVLAEFSARYAKEDWYSILHATQGKFGKPIARQATDVIQPYVFYEWRLASRFLIFIHWTGTDMWGKTVARPFEIKVSRESMVGLPKQKEAEPLASGVSDFGSASNQRPTDERQATLDKLARMDLQINFEDDGARQLFESVYFNCVPYGFDDRYVRLSSLVRSSFYQMYGRHADPKVRLVVHRSSDDLVVDAVFGTQTIRFMVLAPTGEVVESHLQADTIERACSGAIPYVGTIYESEAERGAEGK